jgi:hypothetical protein
MDQELGTERFDEFDFPHDFRRKFSTALGVKVFRTNSNDESLAAVSLQAGTLEHLFRR